MSDPVADYQEKLKSFEKATNAAEKLVKAISAAGKDLTASWRKTNMSNIRWDGGYPDYAMRKGSPTINADEWPSAEQIHKTLVAWHKAFLDLQNAWNLVPTDRRTGLTPPPPSPS